jgi:CheY-like chemotaxis protein
VGEAVSAVKGLFDAKGLYLREEIAANLPPAFIDSTRIRQVVINLLGNAARFVERGGVTVRVEMASGEVTISVADTGPGIAPVDQSRVFEPFQQVDTALRRHKGGTGLGLTISRQFVEMHGGRMWLESQVGAGTTFFFSLPSRQPAGEGSEAGVRRWFNPYTEYEPRTHLANLPAPDVRPRFVLVESEEHLQRLFNRYADSMEVTGVRKVEDGVSEVQRSPARALLLNTPLTLEDPLLRARLAGLPFGTPVIACWLPGKEEAARKLGVVEYLVKPVTRQDVISAVEKVPNAKRILLVDDEPEILRLFVRMLSSTGLGHTLIQAANGRRALQLMRSRKPDLVLLDLVMPEMDGFAVLQEKSKDPEIRDIPVVVVSSLNPRGESSVSASFSVARGEGLSAHELLTCIQSVTDILVPAEQTAGQARAAESAGSPAS